MSEHHQNGKSEDYVMAAGQAGQYTFRNKPNYNISINKDGETIGTLDFNGPALVFTGNAEESAKVFIDWVAQAFHGRLAEERAKERERCAAKCDELANMPTGSADPRSARMIDTAYMTAAAAIRGMKDE